MKTLLFTVSLGVLIGAVFCSSRCLFDVYKDGNPCEKDKQRIAIPCESECANYYECDTNLHPQHQHCFYRNKFNATTLKCTSEEVDCKWFAEGGDEGNTTEGITTPEKPDVTPEKPNTSGPTTEPPETTTQKAAAITISTSAVLILSTSAFATVIKSFF